MSSLGGFPKYPDLFLELLKHLNARERGTVGTLAKAFKAGVDAAYKSNLLRAATPLCIPGSQAKLWDSKVRSVADALGLPRCRQDRMKPASVKKMSEAWAKVQMDGKLYKGRCEAADALGEMRALLPDVSLAQIEKGGALRMALALLRQGEYLEAIVAWQHADAEDQGSYFGLLVMAQALAGLGRLQESLPYFIECTRFDGGAAFIDTFESFFKIGAEDRALDLFHLGREIVKAGLSIDGMNAANYDKDLANRQMACLGGRTPLLVTLRRVRDGLDRVRMVGFLIEQGADVNAVDQHGLNAMGYAVLHEQEGDFPPPIVDAALLQVLRHLIQGGANPNQRFFNWHTPLTLAASLLSEGGARAWAANQLMDVLLQHPHVDLNASDFEGRTALDYALANPKGFAMACKLVEAGCHVSPEKHGARLAEAFMAQDEAAAIHPGGS